MICGSVCFVSGAGCALRLGRAGFKMDAEVQLHMDGEDFQVVSDEGSAKGAFVCLARILHEAQGNTRPS